jgi:hypothetical protein
MNSLTLALSLSNSFTKVGAIAAFAALVGIALLSLLVFSQAREIKRLREWAGRAPERAAEREQRISADASVRAQRERVSAQTAPAARVIPRATPLVSAPVSAAVSTAAAAAASAGTSTVAAAPPGPSVPVAPAAHEPEAPELSPSEAQTPEPSESNTSDAETSDPQADEAAAAAGPANSTPAPATAAARAGGAAGRAPLPPAPATPAPAEAPPPRAAAPVAAVRRTVSIPAKPPVIAARSNSQPDSAPKYYKRERSPRRATALIVGGAIVAVALLVLLLSALRGGGSSHPVNATPAGEVSSRSGRTHARGEGRASSPADTSVTVLNGTSTAGLAHHLAADLQQSGYTRAAASAGVPSGTHPSTVVEYSSGHRPDARRVAKALNVTRVQPIDSSTVALAGSATVVVIAGADQAALLGGGGAQSQGEPAATGGAGAVQATPAASR